MKKISNVSTSMLIIVIILNACGGNSVKSNAPINKTSTDCSLEYFSTAVSTTLNACVACHSAGGQASSTRFLLKSPINDNKNSNYESLKSFVKSTNTFIIEKGTNNISHTGGVAMSIGSRSIMQNFIDYVNGKKTCTPITAVNSIDTRSVQLLSPNKTLRSASLKLTGKLPIQDDLNKATSTDALDPILDKYMKSDYFYEWLGIKFNDFLLTDFYAPNRDAENLLNGNDFVNKYWYDKYWTHNNTDQINMFNNTQRASIYKDVNYAIAREPINLMLHVIKNNRPFSEILTANYVLVNPYSARTYGIEINGFTFNNSDLNLSINAIETKYPKNSLREAKLKGIPHAGILTTITYLNKFPSTNTNLDRHRSAKTQLFFLDTDILALANRPIKAVDVIGNSATWTNPNCTICHNIMEPIAGAFSNWDNRGRYRPGWRVQLAPFSQEPGISISNKTPISNSKNILQWLAKEIVKDDRFSMASVKIFLKALLGRDALKKPQNDDVNYVQALEAYNYENKILTQIKEKFKASNMNAKVIIKELIKSPLYRASALNIDNNVLSSVLGQAHLITPEELDKKIYTTTGYYWSRYMYSSRQKENNNTANHRLLRSDNYKTLYGGINSGSISQRVSELNGVMANIQLRMATQMGCFPTSRDFYFSQKNRKLFPYVDKNLEPITQDSIDKIKRNIQYLHKHILGEDLDINDPEIDATYKLFYDTYTEGKNRVDNTLEDKALIYECRVYYNPITFKRLRDENRTKDEIVYDKSYVIRSWSAVITYLLSDFKFLYETS